MDSELVKKAQKGCRDSFGLLVSDIKNQAYRVAFCYLKNAEDSMDAVCDAMEKAWNGIKKLKQPEFFSTWFIRIVINQCKKKLMENRNTVFLEDCKDIQACKTEFYIQPSGIEIKLDLESLLGNIKSSDRSILYMRYYMDYSLEEISRIMEIPLSTVKTRIYATLKKLRVHITEGGIV